MMNRYHRPSRYLLLVACALAAALAACGASPTTVEQPDVDPEAAKPAPPEDVTPETPDELPEGADATELTDPPGEGEDATPVLDEERDQDGITDPTPER